MTIFTDEKVSWLGDGYRLNACESRAMEAGLLSSTGNIGCRVAAFSKKVNHGDSCSGEPMGIAFH